MNKKIRVLEGEVRSFTSRGNGLVDAANEQGVKLSLEVPYTIVGEKVKARVFGKRKGVYRAALQEILEKASERVEPQCVHFGQCGGCRWQHLDYSHQLQYKQQLINRCFGELLDNIEQLPIIPSVPSWGYRNKMEFSFSETKAGERYLGLVVDGPYRDVFNLSECQLCQPWMSQLLPSVRSWWVESGLSAFNMRNGSGALRTLTLREGVRTGDRMAVLTVSGDPDFALTRPQLDSFVQAVRDASEPDLPGNLSLFLRIQQSKRGMATNFFEMHLYGPDHIEEELEVTVEGVKTKVNFNIGPSAFFQPNSLQAEKLYSSAIALAQVSEGDYVYDLYCGTGTLGICASVRAGHVIGIELSPEAALDARSNVALNQCDNVTIVCGSVGPELTRLRMEPQFRSPGVVMVDPPRAGLDKEAIECLIGIAAPKLVYVSCNPATQAENVRALLEGGYRLRAMQAVDQFPHTAHIENIAVLVRGVE